MRRGSLLIVSAPSGAGKTTLVHRLIERRVEGFGGLVFAVSHTTREARRGEQDGREYHFVDRSTFGAMRAADRFLESATVHGNLYGTSIEEVDPRLDAGIDVVLDIDVQGAEQVLARRPEAVSIFILPPSRQALEQRLLGRGLDGRETVRRRLRAAADEMALAPRYRYAIVNDDVDRAYQALVGIVLERRHRSERMRAELERILADF